VLLSSLSVLGSGPDQLPAEETAVKNDVDHWGLGFSDQFDAFKNKFRQFAEKTGVKSPDYVLGVETALRKTFQNKYWFKGRITNEVELCAARNESEAFQLAVIPKTGFTLENVGISVSDLKTTDEKFQISSSCITLWQVGFVQTVKPQYPTRHIGEWPDPLIEMKPFSVKGIDLGLVWCEIKVPGDTPPGDYRGTLTVSTSNAKPIVLTLNVHVWNLALPDHIPFPTVLWIAGKMGSKEYLDTCRMFLEHHLSPLSVGQTNDLGLLDKNLEFCLSRGLKYFQVPDVSKPEAFRPYYEHLKKKGWLDQALIYGGFDEPLEKTFREKVIPRTAMIHKEFPGLKVFLATQFYEKLDQGTDLWLTDVSANFHSWLNAGRPGNQQLWWYFCHMPIHVDFERPLVDAPNMLIDNDAVEHRLPYWMADHYGVRGIFIWAGNNGWPDNISNWPGKPLRLTEKNMDFPYGGIHNGNGFLIYPGPRPSIRLKVLRDGIEDFWYLTRLKELAKSGPYSAEAKILLKGIMPEIFVDTHYYSRDPNSILAYRKKIGDLLEKEQITHVRHNH